MKPEKGLKGPQIVFALYRPRDGKDNELKKLIAEHIPALRKLDLVTDREPVLMRSENGTYIEVFEWASPEAADLAHQHPEVAKVWEKMAKIADLPPLESLKEISDRFPHFQPVSL